MDNSDDDEDTHFCLKCHATISGLDNYVAHRKNKCGRPKEVPRPIEVVTELKADDFFSSLNLQISSKSGEHITSKTAGVITRSKIRIPKESGGKRKRQEYQDEETDEDESDDEPTPTGGKWKPESQPELWPSPGHTGGKWKPMATPMKTDNSEEIIRNENAPPPSHTRGKWGPTERPWGQLRKGNLYWCGPCNRRLSSRLVYERHIKSELHFKRTSSGHVPQPTRSRRTVKRTKIAMETSLRLINKRYKIPKTNKRTGKQIICDVCRCRVWPHLMGKHLVSHFHCRNRNTHEGSSALVLKHIESIVRQSPFQCALCKFYCNTQQTFINHWTSELHFKNDSKLKGIYWCLFCKFGTESSVDMGCHLVGTSHSEVVSLINHSVPIVIQKRIPLSCDICRKVFKYNAQIRAHSKIWHHSQGEGSASDSYQEKLKCTDCNYTGFSLLSFQRHRRMMHGEDHGFCRLCNLKFSTPEEAKAHRRSKEHTGNKKTSPKPCPCCIRIFPSVVLLKKHLAENHPEHKHKCLKCGEEFLLKQEVTQHIKSNSCKPSSVIARHTPARQHKCRICDFSCETESELMVHNVLHQGATTEGLYPCLYCGRSFKKLSLKNHMRTHTTERPFSCTVCEQSFRRRDTLASHVSRVHDMQLGFQERFECESCAKRFTNQRSLDRHLATHGEGTNNSFTCSVCEQSLDTKSNLERHMQKHFKKVICPEEGCIYKGRSQSELKVHLRTHSMVRDFHCQQCKYSSKTKSTLAKHIKVVHGEPATIICPHCEFKTKFATHLRRHLRIHSGSKPYCCPHCPFTCNLLENLRKHVINSKQHPDGKMYECKNEGCEFKSNFSIEYKSHLVAEHGENIGRAAAYVAGLYKPSEDHQNSKNPLPVKAKKKRAKAEVLTDNLEELVDERTDSRLPTLASVALTPAKPHPEDEVIFIQVSPEDEYDMAVPLYHQPFPSIEPFSSQTNYDQVEIEITHDEAS